MTKYVQKIKVRQAPPPPAAAVSNSCSSNIVIVLMRWNVCSREDSAMDRLILESLAEKNPVRLNQMTAADQFVIRRHIFVLWFSSTNFARKFR